MCSWDSCECSWPASGSLGPLARVPHGAKSSRIRGMERGQLAGGGGRDSERMGSQHPHPLPGPVTPGHGGGGCSWDSGDPGDKPLAWHRLPGAPAGAFTSVGPHSSCSFLAWRLWGLVLSGPRQHLSRWSTCSKLNI